MGRPNPHNLIPFSKRSEEDQKRIRDMGLKKAQEGYKRRREYAETIPMALDIIAKRAIKDITDPEEKDIIKRCGIEVMTLLQIMLTPSSRQSDKLKAVEMVMDRIGGKPTQKQEITGADGNPLQISQVSQEEAIERAKKILENVDKK